MRTAQPGGSSHVFDPRPHPRMQRSRRCSIRLASASSASCASWAISKQARRTWCPRATTRPVTRTPSWPAPWRPRCSNALPLASGPGSRSCLGSTLRHIGSGFGYEGERPTLTGARCASVNGFSLHANTHVPAHRRDELERLLRYTGRGAVSLERLEVNADGDLLYTFTRVRHEVARRNERNGRAASSSTCFTRKEVNRWGSASEGALWCEQHTPERRSETRSRPSRGCA